MSTVSTLLPLMLVPPAQALAVRPTAELQLLGLWGSVSIWRTVGSLVGVGVGVPIVLLTHSVLGACLAIAAAEVLNTALVYSFAKRHRYKLAVMAQRNPRPTDSWSTYRHMALYSALGWLQAQSGRVFLGAWAGTSALGSYSLGSSIGRSAGDAIAQSQANVLRVDLSRSAAVQDSAIREILRRNIRASMFLGAVSALAAVVISDLVFVRILGPEWYAALQMVPILAITAIPIAIAASSAPVHIHRGNSRIAWVAPAVCLLTAPLVALAAVSSLTLAAWVVLLRECLLAGLQAVFMGPATPWREIGFAAVAVAVSSCGVLALGGLATP